MSDACDAASLLERKIEAWSKVVDVQQHFNDMEMRVRSLCLTVLGTILGAAAYSYHQAAGQGIAEQLSSTLLLWIAFIVVSLFWFMDSAWYHRFLVGAVKAGAKMETDLNEAIPSLRLGSEITRSSHYWFLGRLVTSGVRGTVFYGALAAISFAFAVVSRGPVLLPLLLQTRMAILLPGVLLSLALFASLTFTGLPTKKEVIGAACKECGASGDKGIDELLFCKSCSQPISAPARDSTIPRRCVAAAAFTIAIAMALISFVPAGSATKDEGKLVSAVAATVDSDSVNLSKVLPPHAVVLRAYQNGSTVTIQFRIARAAAQGLSLASQALLLGSNGWFAREAAEAWRVNHEGELCSWNGAKYLDIRVTEDTGKALTGRRLPLKPC